MIARLTGTITNTEQPQPILDVNGVGYGVYMTEDDRMSIENSSTQTIYVYEQIQERAHDLYGFLKPDAKQFFELLLGVNGVGPKAALAICDLGPLANIKQAIVDGNNTYLSGASGVGKKTAERVAVDLKDKLADDVLLGGVSLTHDSSVDSEALEALVNLGYNKGDAMQALAKVDAETSEDAVKQALQEL
jgi:Holliday junction DNA helicase RuvA